MAGLEWPSTFETVTSEAPLASISVAAVWRRSWKRMAGNPVRFKVVLNYLVRSETWMGAPVWVTKTTFN